MLKKFVSSLLAIVLLAGCSSSGAGNTTTDKTADATANELISTLGIEDTMTSMKERVIKGSIFDGNEITTDAALYLSSDNGNSDSVGVFYTNDVETCKQYISSYLDSQKANAQTYNADQVFKISNAVIQDNGKVVVMIVCDDIETGKKAAASVLK